MGWSGWLGVPVAWARVPVTRLGGRMRRMGRLVLASAAVMVVATVWFGANLYQPVGPAILLWLPSLVAVGILTLAYLRTARTPALPAPTRRFWRQQSIAAGLIGMGNAAQAIDVLAHPEVGGPHTGPVMLTIYGLALIVIIFALYRVPMDQQTRGERLRVALDAGTVMLATALFIWRFETRPALARADDTGPVLYSLLLIVLAQVGVFAVAKVALSSRTFIDRAALRLLAGGIIVASLAPVLQRWLAGAPHLYIDQLSLPVICFVAVCAAQLQRTAPQLRRRGVVERRRRTFSLLPYAAVAAVYFLLVKVTWYGGDPDERVVVLSAVGVTAVVVVRQLLAFRDNDHLLARLDHGATHDALTQLPNRVLFGHRLDKALTGAVQRPISVALIDLDDFKEVNDTLGHEIGDLLLIAVAQRLLGCVRQDDTVARLGGDEFVVLLDGADPTAAALAAERMIDALRQPVLAAGHELPIRASIGIADGHTGDDPSVLLRRADIAMYAAKARPDSGYRHFEDGMATAGGDNAQRTVELRTAIAQEQFFLLYQPIVTLDEGRLTGVEALLRWAHPERGTLAPDSFIPLAERTGLIVPLGRWVIREACRQLAAWTVEHGGVAPAVLNVNVSARELCEPGFADQVTAAVAEAGLVPARLALEVTETAVFELGASVTNLQALRELGVRIALDDFGTGQSTLTMLEQCPVDELKLDRSFTQAPSQGQRTVAAAVIQLAQALGLHVVAEGVETRQQADRLRALGYQAAQGFYFAHPTSADQFGAAVRATLPLRPAPQPSVAYELSV